METTTANNVIPFPRVHKPPPAPPTPKFDKIAARAAKLAKLSKYPCEFDFGIYKRLETRFAARPPRGGVVFQSPFKLVNSHNTCQQCLYAFEVDTYGRGCIHNCVYCYAVLKMRVPLRIGSMSDSFMFIDKKYQVTQELLKILNYYDYPYIIFTRSDLISHDEYMQLLRPDLCSIQMSIASIDDAMNRLIEPGAPSAKRRFSSITKTGA